MKGFWRRLPRWLRALLTLLALLFVVYWLGFFLLSCGTESGSGVGDRTGSRAEGEVHFPA